MASVATESLVRIEATDAIESGRSAVGRDVGSFSKIAAMVLVMNMVKQVVYWGWGVEAQFVKTMQQIGTKGGVSKGRDDETAL